ncbi:hypothetical protein BOX15_Mlig011309g1, partial [Macrostomum lignano]
AKQAKQAAFPEQFSSRKLISNSDLPVRSQPAAMASKKLRREVRVFLFSNEGEFEVEKSILQNVVTPQLRKFCIETFSTDFLLIDPLQSSAGVKLPKRSSRDCLRDSDDCFDTSDGPAALVLVGEKFGNSKLPPQLSEPEFAAFLNGLKKKNDPLWTSFQKLYAKQSDLSYKLQGAAPDLAESLRQRLPQVASEAVGDGTLTQDQVDALFVPPVEHYLKYLRTDKKPIDQCIAFARVLKDVREWGATEDPELKEQFLDLDAFGRFSQSSNEKVQQLREEFLQRLPKENYVRFSISSAMLSEYKLVQRNKSNVVSKLAETPLASKDMKATTYLTIFAKQTFEKLKNHVMKFCGRHEFLALPLPMEIETHSAVLAGQRVRPPVFSRDRELKILQNYVASKSQLPGLLYGDHGSGKTAIIKQLIDQMTDDNLVIIKRCCGRTTLSCTLQQIIASVTQEIYFHARRQFAPSCEYAQVVYDFTRALQLPGFKKQLLIVLDDIDLLYPQSHTELFRWLPHRLPANVKVLVTAGSESFLTNFKRRFDDSSSLTLTGVVPSAAIKEFPSILAAKGKAIGDKNRELANSLLQNNSYPLYTIILADVLPCREDKLPDRVKLVFMKRLEQLEQKHGLWVVKSILSYISCSRFGLSLPELQDVLSLDNSVAVDSGFDAKHSNFYRVPMGIITAFLDDVELYLIRVQLDDRLVYTWAHDVLRSAVTDYYQLNKEFGVQVSQQLAEYWSGRWAGAKAKPLFEKSQTDGDESKSVNVDRVALYQSFMWSGRDLSVSNNRKLSELTYSLLKGEKVSDLYRSCLFNFDYLYAKLNAFSVNDLISEFYFLRQNYEVRANQEVEVLISLLRLLAPIIEKDLSLMGIELSGRLCHLAGSQVLITGLLQQIDSQGSRVNCLCPVVPSFPPVEMDETKVPLPGPASVPIQCALSPDNRFLATLLLINGELFLYVWDAKSATKSQILNLGEHDGSKFLSITYMPQTDEQMLLYYKKRVSDRDTCGYLFLNLSTATFDNKLEFRASEKPKIVYLTKSYVVLRVDGKVRVYQHSNASPALEFKNFHWPFLITPNDKYIIAPKAWKTDSSKVETNLRLLNTTTGDQVCVLSCHLYSTCLLSNARTEFVFVGCKNLGLVLRYDIAQAIKRDIKKLTPSMEFSLERQENLGPEFKSLFAKYKSHTSVTNMMLSIDEKYLIVEYNINDIRTVETIWSLSQKTVQAVLPQVPNAVTRFSVDGAHVYQFVLHSESDTTVRLFNCSSGELVQQVSIGSRIEDVYVVKERLTLLVTPNQVTLSSLKSPSDRPTQVEAQVAYYGTALNSPYYHTDLNILYDNNPNLCDFTFLNLDNGSYLSYDMTHKSEVIGSFPVQRKITPDGEKLLLIFEAKKPKRASATEDFSSQPDARGGAVARERGANLRKPELPNRNYFTGGLYIEATPTVGRPAKPRPSPGDPYGQKVIRVHDTDTGQLVSQISITGEAVSHVTSRLLLTLKPDHASRTRESPEANDILSAYDLQTGQFLQQTYLEHRIIASKLVESNSRLVICCGRNGRFVKTLGGKLFERVQHEVDVASLLKGIDEYARIPLIKGMLVPDESPNIVLLQFVIKENEIQYAKVDIQKACVISSFSTQDYIRDITRDGKVGIDKSLRLYDTTRGDALKQLSLSPDGADAQQLDTIPRFIGDGSLIVVLDKAQNELTILRNDGSAGSGTVLGRSILHRLRKRQQGQTPSGEDDEEKDFQLVVGHAGKVALVFTETEFKVFVVRDDHLRGKRLAEQAYHGISDRCRHLMGLRRHNSLDSLFAKRAPSGQAETAAEKEDGGKRAKKGRSPKVGSSHKSPVEKSTPTRK